jgi:hypothetical protein
VQNLGNCRCVDSRKYNPQPEDDDAPPIEDKESENQATKVDETDAKEELQNPMTPKETECAEARTAGHAPGWSARRICSRHVTKMPARTEGIP